MYLLKSDILYCYKKYSVTSSGPEKAMFLMCLFFENHIKKTATIEWNKL